MSEHSTDFNPLLPQKKRLSATKRLDYVHLAQAVVNEMHLTHEFEQIPENRVSWEV